MADDENDRLAMQLARDGEAVSFLSNKVVEAARSHVFTELRGMAAAVLGVLAIVGISSWSSIDGKVEAEVAKTVKEEFKDRKEDIQGTQLELVKKLAVLDSQMEQNRKQLVEVDKATLALREQAKSSLREIERELEMVRAESNKARVYIARVMPTPLSETNAVEFVFGELPENFYGLSGTTGSSFGMGLDAAEGGLFTTTLLRVWSDKQTDVDNDEEITLDEIANACRNRQVPHQREPSFGGHDFALFAAEDLTPQSRPARKLHALVIGLNNVDPSAYGGWQGNLIGPEKDVERVAASLENSKRVMASSVSISKLKSTDATQAGIRERIGSLKEQVAADDVVLFYFSGHASQKRDTTDTSSDGTKNGIGAYDGLMDLEEVVRLLDEIKVGHVVVILDC